MKRKIIAVLLSLCLCAALSPGALAAEATLESSVNVDQLLAHAMQMYLELEGRYDSVTPKDSNALSIGFMQWHGVAALNLMKRICATDPELSKSTLGSALYNEILQTPLWSSTNGNGWKNRVLSAAEAAAIRTLISSDVGITCQNQYANELILEEAQHGWNRGVRTESALLYYCTVENQYGVGNVAYFMQYVRTTMGIGEGDTINSLDEFHNAVLEAANSYSSIRNYLGGRKKVYNYLVNVLQLPSGPDVNPTPFEDLPAPGHWARDAIEWAYLNQITGGTSDTAFSPDGTVTRAEAVTFLWAATGRPGHSTEEIPFRDVKKRHWAYDAVMWAVENGITGGTAPSTFSPKVTVLREDMLTFLWAAFGHEVPVETENPFSDVSPGKYYYNAVLWAVANGVLVGNEGGDEPTLLLPKTPCSRAYVVSYLYNLFQ